MDELLKKSNEVHKFHCAECGKELIADELLSKYGPEGLYDLADLLKRTAIEDVSDSITMSWEQ